MVTHLLKTVALHLGFKYILNQKPSGFGIAAVWLPDSLETLISFFGILPRRASLPKSTSLPYAKGTISQSPYRNSQHEISVYVNESLEEKTSFNRVNKAEIFGNLLSKKSVLKDYPFVLQIVWKNELKFNG